MAFWRKRTKRDGRDLEDYVHFVYTNLLNLRGEGQQVIKNHQVTGRSGAAHEVDVFYEFQRAGVLHRVAIECKDHGRPLSKGRVQEFQAKLVDIGNILGYIVAPRGFQDGARQFAEHYGIGILTENQLPEVRHLIAGWIDSVFLPSADYVGEPFWAIMEESHGEVTGTYRCVPASFPDGKRYIPLFISKRHAEMYLADHFQQVPSAIRGLPQHVVKGLLPFVKYSKDMFLAHFMSKEENDGLWVGIPMPPELVERDFVLRRTG